MESQIIEILKTLRYGLNARQISQELKRENDLTLIKRTLAKMVKNGTLNVKKVKAYHNTYNPSFGGTVYAQHMENRYWLPTPA